MAATLTDAGELTYLSFPITKTETTDDGDLIVYGKATDGSVDSDEQIVDPEWSAKALQDWLESGGNVRVQHNPSLYPAGKGIQVDVGPDGHYVKSLIVESTAKRLVEKGVLTAYSVGISRPDIVRDAVARGGRITGGPHTQIVEISLVDRPANKNCGIQLVKAADDGAPEWVGKVFGGDEVASVIEVPETSVFSPADLAKLLKHREQAELTEKRDVDPNVGGGTDRDKIPAADFAGRDRSFPIVTPGDVSDAASSIGRAGSSNYSSDELKRRIIAIARRKGGAFVEALPESWKSPDSTKSDAAAADGSDIDPSEDVEDGATETDDVEKAATAATASDDGDGDDDEDEGDEGGVATPDTAKASRDCPKCGKTFHADTDAKNCDNCGTKLPKVGKARHAVKVACGCGKSVSAGDAFCSRCGTKNASFDGKSGKPTPAAGVTGEQGVAPVPAHREPDGAAIEAFERDASMPTVSDAGVELRTATRLKSLGVPSDVGAIHDLTCAAYHPEVATKCHPNVNLVDLDVDVWQQKALRAATSAPLSEAMAATTMWQHVVSLKNLPADMVEDLRGEVHKAFQDANPGPGSAPSPSEISPTRFKRPYISEGHAAPSPGHDGPNTASVPTSDLNASQFDRPYTTTNTALDSPSNKSSAVIEVAPIPPHIGRTYYTNAQREGARSAMASMHDHIAQTFPDLCPMTGGGGQPATGQRPVPVPVGTGKMENAAPEVVKDVNEQLTKVTSTVEGALLEITAPEVLNKAAVADVVKTVVAEVTSEVTTKLSEIMDELKAEKRRTKKLQEAVDALCSLPDPATAPFKGVAQHPITAKTALPAGARTVAETAEQAQLAMMDVLQAQARTNPDPAQREAAWAQLYKMTGLPTGP